MKEPERKEQASLPLCPNPNCVESRVVRNSPQIGELWKPAQDETFCLQREGDRAGLFLRTIPQGGFFARRGFELLPPLTSQKEGRDVSGGKRFQARCGGSWRVVDTEILHKIGGWYSPTVAHHGKSVSR